MLLIGGTSNAGKSTVAEAAARRLGFVHMTTDTLARHPGRPWRTPEREVPTHVAEHYASLSVDELITSVLGHYERLWPRILALITAHAAQGQQGLVLEGSALWPARVAELDVPRTAAVWLTADEAVLRARVHAGGRYAEATGAERALMDRFLERTYRFQQLMVAALDEFGLGRIDVDGLSVVELADAVLSATAHRN